jgi:putative redox protein
MPAERFDFPNASGERLAALLDRPSGNPQAFALFAHCFTCGKDVHAARRIAEGLTARGIAVLRFDFTGLGASEGEFANTNFSSNVADLVAAANHLRKVEKAPALLIGHSLGGAAVLAAAGGGWRRAGGARRRHHRGARRSEPRHRADQRPG